MKALRQAKTRTVRNDNVRESLAYMQLDAVLKDSNVAFVTSRPTIRNPPASMVVLAGM